MNRIPRNRITVLAGIVLSGVVTITAAAYQVTTAPPPGVVEVDKLKDNLYVMKGGGGNTAVFIASDGVTVVDTKYPGWGAPLMEKIRNVTSKPVIRIINTHTHWDHVSGNVEFPASVDVVTHEYTKGAMNEMKVSYGIDRAPDPKGPIFQQHNGRGLAKRTFKDTMKIGSGADEIDLYYFGRAHTGGDAFVVFPALRVVHVGDTFPNRALPLMDSNNGGSGVEFPQTLARAYASLKNIDTIINGHNATTTTMADLKIQGEFVGDFVKFVQEARRAGKTPADVAATWKTPAKYVGYPQATDVQIKRAAEVIFNETR